MSGTLCLNSTCTTPSLGLSTLTFASAVQFFAAATCFSEGTYPDADIEDSARFDFIIIGAGSTGSVLANRLSEVEDWNILLIEAGGDPPTEAAIPALHSTLYSSKYNWGYRTTNNGIINQGNIDGSIDWPRGKVLGGSSNINAMFWVKGNTADYQRWHDAGNSEWSVDDVQRCFKKAESLQDEKIAQIPGVIEQYGQDGPLVINTFNLTNRILADNVLSAWNDIGFENVQDLNAANVFGSGTTRVTVSNGERNSVSKAYLQPIKNRPNLQIMQNTLVTKVLINGDNTLNKQAYGVEVERNRQIIKIYANKEVIVSAGTINSPQLLMLSGIGPEQHLESKSIQTIVDFFFFFFFFFLRGEKSLRIPAIPRGGNSRLCGDSTKKPPR
ncbi:ecdysone oxidase-like [Anticarsia gemmatalis]|uniref:ecdysone oxidase-like n=1 Tax=Anticarsia gemmatalis TaxID=129554 RepID=UPI003F76B812